ncbi:MAG: hypothetical protein HYS25_05240 [Ignavibacteriales bacterium]|nr:hypothetical protein [Ignavibacteriales bacterium]
MKATRYFREQVLTKRSYLKEEWILEILSNPLKKEIQQDDRIRFWGFVDEIKKYLRVVTLSDGETVHNAFPDRNFEWREK